jgi:hypothetical protein
MERTRVHRLRDRNPREFEGHRIGVLESIDESGVAWVTFPGCNGVPVAARSTIATPLRAGDHPEDEVGSAVLLVFEDADPARPVILGFVRGRLRPEPVREEVRLDPTGDRDVLVDGQRLVFDAQREIVLRCGKSTIVLRRDGKVLVRGAHLVSRATGANKIKGGTVSLN